MWEYKIAQSDELSDLVNHINELGQIGWELVNCWDNKAAFYAALKRRVDKNGKPL